ncbi:unnamed protein product [Rotaria sp. Silwood2]|nr:unnamed protein product [Rotaria sp. Silwood2]
MGATRAHHSVKGVARQLRVAMCNHARQTKGFEYALAQPINQDTRYIYLNEMNGKELSVIDPTTWLWKKTGNESAYPYENYTGGCIPNILVKLVSVGNA